MFWSRMTQKVFSCLVCFGVILLSSWAFAGDIEKSYRGKLIISEEAFPTTLDKEMDDFLKTVSKKNNLYTVQKGIRDQWSFHMMAVFNRDPGNDSINLVFYDSEDKESQKRFEPVQNLEFQSQKGIRVFGLPDISISTTDGFEEGKTYLLKITQLKKGREIVLSEAKITLAAKAKP